jgi:hypothetical protein
VTTDEKGNEINLREYDGKKDAWLAYDENGQI